jgi:phospholipid N-methyltransferase
MHGLKFVWQYFTKPRTVGAIAPSSRFLARKIIKPVDFNKARCIVEFGPGTGVFTKQLLEKRKPDTVLILIERNEDFCKILLKKYENVPNLHIINGSAEKIGTYLFDRGFPHADCIVSGLPFASLPNDVSERIITQAKKHLHPQGNFITFQYTLFKKDFFNRFFRSIEITREIRNLPPAYVLNCRNI